MKKILVSQRVDIGNAYGERRDAIDQRWYSFLSASGLLPIFVPNKADNLAEYLALADGVLLTGGNSLVECGGDAPERDVLEKRLVQLAVDNSLPLLGVCRGMQVIARFFGTNIRLVHGHINIRHELEVKVNSKYKDYLSSLDSVNSFHNFGLVNEDVDEKGPLLVSAVANAGIVKAIEHMYLPVFAIMWHVEREFPFVASEIKFFNEFFNKNVDKL